jgi:hypothetical protein
MRRGPLCLVFSVPVPVVGTWSGLTRPVDGLAPVTASSGTRGRGTAVFVQVVTSRERRGSVQVVFTVTGVSLSSTGTQSEYDPLAAANEATSVSVPW